MIPYSRSALWCWLLLLASIGCAGPSQDKPLRSPSLDYPHPAPRTSDGQVVGADGVDPADKLREGPTVGSKNKPAAGWKADDGTLKPDPGGPAGTEPNPSNGPPP